MATGKSKGTNGVCMQGSCTPVEKPPKPMWYKGMGGPSVVSKGHMKNIQAALTSQAIKISGL